MNKLKEYYDKIILTAFLLLFVVVLVVMLKSIGNIEKQVTKQDHERLISMVDDYQGVDSSIINNVDALFLGKSWNMIQARNGHVSFTDLTSPYELARCPECKMLISYKEDVVNNKLCSFFSCKANLSEPEKIVERLDSDGDGIPDDVWISLGLPVIHPKDEDFDNDGWTNVEEYELAEREGKRDYSPLKDAKKHPTLLHYYSIDKITQETLSVKMVSSSHIQDSAKARFYLILDGKRITKPFTVGSNFAVKTPNGEMSFEVIGGYRSQPKGALSFTDYMTVKCLRTNQKFDVKKGEEPKHPSQYVSFLYGETPLDGIYTIGDKVTVGNDRLGKEVWTIQNIDGYAVELVSKKAVYTVSDTPDRSNAPDEVRSESPVESDKTPDATTPSNDPFDELFNN